MIQKAIVEAILNDYQVKVRIPKYDKMSYDGASYKELSTGIICSAPGTLVNYSKGDVVLVAFENDEISKPVVLGLLYTNKSTEASVKLPAVSEELDSINESLDKIKNRNVYIHIKYSNDGGVTFTSLYDYAHVDPLTPISGGRVLGRDIEINPKSSFVAWNIVDKNGVNALNKFTINTNIRAWNEDGSGQNLTSSDKVINIPDSFNYYDNITIDSYELATQEGVISDYYISLFTDKDPVGSVAGDYIGIYYSNSETPSSNPIDYSWGAIKLRVQEFIDEAYEKLRARVRKNEKALYGVWDETDEDYSTDVDTDRGLLDAANVPDTSTFDISLKQNVVLSTRTVSDDTTESAIMVDTISNGMYFNNIKLTAVKNGHLRIETGNRRNMS
jgi:hypothetical protein